MISYLLIFLLINYKENVIPFAKKDPNINKNGRPRGSRNKVNADRDISNAMSSGMSLEEIVILLSEKIIDDEVSDVQKNKYLQQLITLKLALSKEELKILESKVTKPVSSKKKTGEVKEFPKAIFKRN